MMSKMKSITLFFLMVMAAMPVYPCTTAVISGKATPDGRPVLWKLRDTDYLENYMKRYDATSEAYAFIGLVNSIDTLGLEVWGGHNEKGFAIMNSASFNLNLGDTAKIDNREGRFMRKALERCVSLKDFEALLDSEPKPMGLAAHFGVIDASGGAAFYEVNNRTWTKYDANDPEVAPDGYVLRTNFSQTGKPNIGYGFVRLQAAERLFEQAYGEKRLDHENIIQNFARSLYNPVTQNDYKAIYENEPASEKFIHSDNLITSYGSASNIVIHGVRPDEDANFTTTWILVGYPNTCMAIPLWVGNGKIGLPCCVQYDETLKNSSLNAYSMKLFKECYPLTHPDGYHYLRISKLVNKEGTGYMQILLPIEKQLMKDTRDKLSKWYKHQPSDKEISDFYSHIDSLVEVTYTQRIAVKK